MYQSPAEFAMIAPQHARLGARDELLDATAGLEALNRRAGGNRGSMVALPALARVARLARSLQTPVARTLIVGDDHVDLELHVRAVPNAGHVDLHIERVTPRAAKSSWLSVQLPRATDEGHRTVVPMSWNWRTDNMLVLTALELDSADPSPLRASDVLGCPLTRLIRLVEDDAGDLPILTASGTGTAFDSQRAVRRDLPGVEWLLSGHPRHDAAGRWVGFAGTAIAVPAHDEQPPPILDPAVTRWLQGALRGPLDRIVGRADTIRTQADGPLRRDYIDYAGDIARAGRHLLALVEDLADLEAVEDPQFVVDDEPIDIADLARRGAGLLAVRAADAGVRIDAPPADDPLPARGDFRRALQIVVNLIANAVRYSPRGAMVWVRIERDDDTSVLIVADQGKGIDPSDHDRIFDKFERVDPSEGEGSGLGLYISRNLARAMGGDIVVDSALGQGARFVLTLPAA